MRSRKRSRLLQKRQVLSLTEDTEDTEEGFNLGERAVSRYLSIEVKSGIWNMKPWSPVGVIPVIGSFKLFAGSRLLKNLLIISTLP